MSRSEFEAVLSQACIKIDKVLYERGQVPALEEARRTLAVLQQCSRDAAKVKSLRGKLEVAADVVIAELDHEPQVREDLWDCLDYIDFRV